MKKFIYYLVCLLLFSSCVNEESNIVVEKEVEAFIPKKINLVIPGKSFSKILAKREEAFERGFLINDKGSWVKGFILNDDSSKLKVELRLKGDLLDHLKGDKWSFRVKVKKGGTWNRMKTFSLQNPSVREFLNEWFYHKFLEKEDVLAPRYDFIELSINGKSKGIYAYEEHFDKQLVESQRRREGPIVKFTEDGLWAGRERGKQHFGEVKYPSSLTDFYEANSIKPFKEGSTLSDSNLYQQFLVAHRLMTQYKYQLKSPGDFFDLDKLAKFYAINDVCSAWHGLFWNNQRFYYNPVIQKLEPVAYDGFSYAPNWTGKPFYGLGMYNKKKKYKDGSWVFYTELFMDSLYMANYNRRLYQFSNSEYISELFDEYDLELKRREKFLQTEFEDYTFDRDKFINKAKEISSLVLPFDDISVKAFPMKDRKTAVFNHHKLPLNLIGEGGKKGLKIEYAKPITLSTQINFDLPYEYNEIIVSDSTTHLYYNLLGLDSIFSCKISDFKLNEKDTPQQEMISEFLISKSKIKGVNYFGNEITFNGDITISNHIVIPSGHKVIIKEGTTINFVNGAGLISYSGINAIGNEENIIKIYSEDESAKGFTILQADDYSKFKNVYFTGFNTLSYKKWNLTGAITFYESDVLIDDCVFENNSCEDMLNIVRSNFDINNLIISDAFADGFDADFCSGKIDNSKFYKIGNDGLDFSGSTIKVNNSTIKDAGDKGISVGEQSIVYVNNIEVVDANIGFASKDLSTFGAEEVNISNCDTALVSFQKKPEFGGGKISVNNLQLDNVKLEYYMDEKSEIKIEGVKKVFK